MVYKLFEKSEKKDECVDEARPLTNETNESVKQHFKNIRQLMFEINDLAHEYVLDDIRSQFNFIKADLRRHLNSENFNELYRLILEKNEEVLARARALTSA
jgi:hypothetical protein